MSRRLVARHAPRALAVPLLLAALAAPTPHRAAHAAPAAMRTITISAARLAFPASIPAGMLSLRLVADAHHLLDVGLARINPGASMAAIQAASAAGDMARLGQFVTFIGGEGVPVRGTGTVVLDLHTPGRYGLHVARADQDPGQMFLFTVTPAVAPAATSRADVHVTLRGTTILGMPRSLRAGSTTFQVSNRAQSIRDLVLFRIDPGKTVQDVLAASRVDAQTGKDPSWLHGAGSVDVLSPHQTAWATLVLAPGSYVALCPLPDPQAHGRALIYEGMITSFTVS